MQRLIPLLLAASMAAAACGGDPASAPVSSSVATTGSTSSVPATTGVVPPPECPIYSAETPFPGQPVDVPFPTDEWPIGPPIGLDPDAALALVDEALEDPDRPWGRIDAVLAAQGGQLTVERYAETTDPDAVRPSFSIAKTVLHAAVGIADAEGVLDPDAPVGAREWADVDDPRQAVTTLMLLEMSSGLAWEESGLDLVIFVAATEEGNAAAAQARRSLLHEPGTVFEYSTGSSAIAARALADALDSEELDAWLQTRLFDPLGVGPVALERDAEGYWIGGSGADMRPRDYLRFGLLYLRGGMWDGQSVVPRSWIDASRRPTQAACDYGAGLRLGRFTETSYSAEGFLGQNLVMVPDQDLAVLVLAAEPRADLVDELARRLIAALSG